LGFCIAIVTVAEGWINKGMKTKVTTLRQLYVNRGCLLFTVVILLFSIRSVARSAQWKDNLTLLSVDVKSSPNSARIRYAYGSAVLVEQALKENDKNKKQELLRASIAELEKGVAIIEDYADAWKHLGIAY